MWLAPPPAGPLGREGNRYGEVREPSVVQLFQKSEEKCVAGLEGCRDESWLWIRGGLSLELAAIGLFPKRK